jgi:hypothetical protein
MVDFRVKSRPGVSGFVDRKRFSLGRTTTVYPLFHDCRSFEYDHATRRDRYIDARLGISAHTPAFFTQAAGSEDQYGVPKATE